MAGLDMDFILSEEETENLFSDTPSTQETPPDVEVKEPKNKKEDTQETTEVEVDPETLFEEPIPESVGSKKEKNKEVKDKENTIQEDADISPNNNFYSSYANAFKVDGIFQNLSDEDIEGITDAESFVEAAEKEVRLRLEESQRRVLDALNAKIEPSVISQYENTLKYLDNISEVNISEEGEDGEKLRTNLIYQDYLNRGFSKERAEREVKRAFDNGTDIEDAKEALSSNRQFFKDKYDKLVKEAQQETVREKEAKKKENEALKTSILNEEKVYGDIELDAKTRQKIYDNISKPVYKDPETGEYLTAIQKYEAENRQDFLKNLAFFYTMTDGFKNMDALVKGKVKKGVSKGIKDLERVLTSTPTPKEGNLRYMGGSQNSVADSFLNGKFRLDI